MTTQKKAILAVCIISFVLTLNSLTSSLAANIRADYPDVAEGTFRLIVSLPSLVGLFATFAIGPLSMKLNKKMLVVFCAVCMLLYFGTFALIGPNGPFFAFILASVLAGICQGGSVTLTSVIIGDFVEQSKRASTMAFSGAILNIGAALINVVGGSIGAGNGGRNWPMAYYLGAIVIPALLLFIILMPSKPENASEGGGGLMDMAGGGASTDANAKGIPLRVILMTLSALLVSLSFAVFILYMSEYIVERNIGDASQAGLAMALFMVAGVIEGFTYPFWEKLWKKWIVFAGYASISIGLVLMLTATGSIINVFIAAVLIGYGVNMASPYAMTTMMSLTPAKLVPIVISLFMGAMNLGIAGAPLVLVPLSQIFGGGIPNYILVGVILSAIGAVASILLYVFIKKPEAAAVEEAAEPGEAGAE